MDQHVFQQSLNTSDNDVPFKSRSYVFMNDNNNSSYSSGQVFFDLATLSNANKYIDFQNSFITMPLVLALQTTGAAVLTGNVENAFALSLKNGVHHLIDSLSLQITNNGVVNSTQFSNLDINYKIISQFSNDDAQVLKDTLLFGLDSVETIGFTGAASLNGIASTEYNNVIQTAAPSVAGGWGTQYSTQNQGRLNRMRDTSFDPTSTNAAAFTGVNQCVSSIKNYVANSLSTASIIYHIMAVIPLRFLHPIFTALPLTKGIYATLVLNTNTQCNAAITIAGNAYTGCVLSMQHQTLPFMISPNSAAGSTGLRCPAATTLNASLAIAKSYDGQVNSTFYNSCRFYASCIEMEASHEEMYLTNLPSKVVKYNDLLNFQTLSIGSNSSFSQVLTNQVARVRYLIGIPIIDTAANGGINPMASPFTSCPGTCMPYATITNFNVLLSGVQVYPANISYGFESYMEEIRPSGSINGGLSIGMNSGLISKGDWEIGYRYIVVDLSRKVSPADDNVGRSIQVIGTNSSPKTMTIQWIVAYEREICISTATGNLIL